MFFKIYITQFAHALARFETGAVNVLLGVVIHGVNFFDVNSVGHAESTLSELHHLHLYIIIITKNKIKICI